MGEFIGEIRPIYNRWHWPLRVMKPGDWFIVDKTLRNTEELRNLMSVRAAQLGIKLSITKRPEEYPGFTKVEMVDLDKPVEKPDALEPDWETAKAKLFQWYRHDIDSLPFGMINDGVRIDVAQREEPPVARMIIDANERNRVIGLTFDEKGFFAESLPIGSSAATWKQDRDANVRLEDIMEG